MKVMLGTRNQYFLILISLMCLCLFQSKSSANEWVVRGKIAPPGCDISVPDDCWDNILVRDKKSPMLKKEKCEEIRDFLRNEIKEKGLIGEINCIFGYQGD